MLQRLIQRYKDYQREFKIKMLMSAYHKALFYRDNEEALRAWIEAGVLIKGRSPEQVKRMEKQKGLCR